VCNSGSRYVCYNADNQVVNYDLGGVSAGNEISSTGVRIASSRLLLGYERLLSKNVGLGLKLGAVIRGKAVIPPGASSFFNFHGEARLTLYPGADPFSPKKHVRPYIFASGGVAESDSKLNIEVVDLYGNHSEVVAWKRSGKWFASGGFGITFPFTQNTGPFVEGRFLRMFEKPSYAMAAMGGWAIGF
jgi:hypothetical protein